VEKGELKMLNEEQLKNLQKGDIIYDTCEYHWKQQIIITTKVTYDNKYNCYCFNAKNIGGIWDKQTEKYRIDIENNNLFLKLEDAKKYQDKCIREKKEKLSKDKKLLFQTLYNIAESSMTKADQKLYREVLKEL
jgi:hypothetical protein